MKCAWNVETRITFCNLASDLGFKRAALDPPSPETVADLLVYLDVLRDLSLAIPWWPAVQGDSDFGGLSPPQP